MNLNHLIQSDFFVKLLIILRKHSKLLRKLIPLIRIDRKGFASKYIAEQDMALDDCRLPLAYRHNDYANALVMTGANLSDINNEFDLALSYSPRSEVDAKKHALHFRWFSRGSSQALAELQEEVLSEGGSKQLAAEYALNCLELGRQDKAVNFLTSYALKKGIEYSLHLPLAHFAVASFPWASEYNNHAKTFEWLERNHEQFETRIKEGSVCIVGNSPIEIGKGHGSQIDTYHTIIRFNNFSTDKSYQNDYGSKTDIWVRAGTTDVDDREIPGLSFVIWEEDVWHTRLLARISAQMTTTMESGIKSTYIPSIVHQELRQIANLAVPSTGLVTCYWVYKILGKLDPGALFGFSMTDQIDSITNKHYFRTTGFSSRVIHHNWIREKETLQRMLNGSL